MTRLDKSFGIWGVYALWLRVCICVLELCIHVYLRLLCVLTSLAQAITYNECMLLHGDNLC